MIDDPSELPAATKDREPTGPEPAQSEPTEAAPDAPASGEGAPQKSEAWSSESLGQIARAIALLCLVGMGIAACLQLAFGREFLEVFLERNRMEMPARMRLIAELALGGGLCALSGLGATFYLQKEKPRAEIAQVVESWAWFLSPLMLLPAIPVTLAHRVWKGDHEDFLPIILFGALICEVLFSHALSHIPEPIRRLLAQFKEEKVEANALEADDGAQPKTAKFSARVLGFIEQNRPLIVVVVAALAYGVFMSFYTVRWHNKLGTATFDLGINNNLLYGGLSGHINESTIIFPEDPQKYLANHVKLGLYTFLPLYALYPKPEMLLILQSVMIGLGAIPLFLFCKRRIPAWWAAALAICYLSYYPLHGANFYEMKIVPTSVVLVLMCIWAIDTKRWITGGIFFVWALIMREDMPVPLAVVGMVFLLSGHRPRAGAAIALVSTVWFVLLRFRFMNEVGSWWFPNMYEDLWAAPEKSFRGVIKTLVSNPAFTLKHIFVEKKFWYLMHMLIPLAFLPVRRWYGWAAMVPGAILTLLVTDYAPPTMFSFQYVMHWAPYLFIASALVLASMLKEENGRPRALAALIAMCLASSALSYNYGAFPRRDKSLESGYHKIEFSFSKEEAQTLKEVRRLVASIPDTATVASTERIGAHLSSRYGFYTLRRGYYDVDYIVANKSGLRLDRTKQTVTSAIRSGKYGVVGRYGEFVVFKMGAPIDQNAAIMKEWQLGSLSVAKRRPNSNKKLPQKPTEASGEDSGENEPEEEVEETDLP